jgi:hypothetical protein
MKTWAGRGAVYSGDVCCAGWWGLVKPSRSSNCRSAPCPCARAVSAQPRATHASVRPCKRAHCTHDGCTGAVTLHGGCSTGFDVLSPRQAYYALREVRCVLGLPLPLPHNLTHVAHDTCDATCHRARCVEQHRRSPGEQQSLRPCADATHAVPLRLAPNGLPCLMPSRHRRRAVLACSALPQVWAAVVPPDFGANCTKPPPPPSAPPTPPAPSAPPTSPSAPPTPPASPASVPYLYIGAAAAGAIAIAAAVAVALRRRARARDEAAVSGEVGYIHVDTSVSTGWFWRRHVSRGRTGVMLYDVRRVPFVLLLWQDAAGGGPLAGRPHKVRTLRS